MFRVINVHYYKARKNYHYYNGVITAGEYYYRGFAVKKNGNIPFEFFFTDDKIFCQMKISTNILYKEYLSYINRKKRGF